MTNANQSFQENQPKLIERTFTFEKNQRISVDGYLYQVIRKAGKFFTIKFIGVDPAEFRPIEHRRRLSIGDGFRIADKSFVIISGTSGVWLRCRLRPE